MEVADVNPAGGLAEDQWWSQGCLFRSDEAYREELRLYRMSLIPDDVRAGKVGSELEVRSLPRTGGDCVSGSTEKKAIEIINDLFAREAERGGEACALTTHLPPLNSSRVWRESLVVR
jgi:hypothetical protein